MKLTPYIYSIALFALSLNAQAQKITLGSCVTKDGGDYNGEMTGGKPHGKGRMRITRTYTIELVDITGSKITVYPGETIDAMLDHGRIRGGDIIHKDGSSTTFVNNL